MQKQPPGYSVMEAGQMITALFMAAVAASAAQNGLLAGIICGAVGYYVRRLQLDRRERNNRAR